MTDPLRLLQAGDRLNGIPAAAWNAFVNAAKYVQQLQATGAAPALGSLIGPGQVFVLNNSGDDQDQYAVLQIDEALIAPADNQPGFASRVALSCVTPTANRKGSFVVLSRPIPAGEVGPAWIDGVCPARISGGGSWADTKNGETAYLEAGDYGNARIIADPTGGTSERWAYVRLNDRRGFILVQTVAGPDATPYPAEGDNPNVYRCQILSAASFTKAAGSQVLSYTPTGRYDHVMNLVDDHYIEEDSVLGALELDGQIYTMDKIRQKEIVVLGHSLGTTDVGTGTLSRISPATGAPIWTVDLGVDGSSRPKIVYAVDLDSRGNVYAYWRPAFSTAGDGHALGSFGTQGVKKYDRDGNELASLDLPNVNASFVTPGGSLVTANVNIKVDPNDDTRIYVGCDYDTDGFWLYRLDDSLTVQWGAGPTEVGASVLGRCCGVAVGNDGKVYASNTNGGVYQFDDAGTFLDDDSTFVRADGMAIDPNSGRLKITQDESDGAVAVAGYAAFPTVAYAKNRFDFPEPEALGTWNVSSLYNFRGSSCVATGAHVVSASIIPMQYARSGGGNGQASYLVTDASGNPVASGAWPDTIDGRPIYGIAFNASTGSYFVTGAGGQSGKIDPLLNTIAWTNQTYTTPAAGDERGWSIAARTCRL